MTTTTAQLREARDMLATDADMDAGSPFHYGDECVRALDWFTADRDRRNALRTILEARSDSLASR